MQLERQEYPKFYFCRGGKSDLSFILSRVQHIPKRYRERVARRYEILYHRTSKQCVRTARKRANTYINKVAKAFNYGKVRNNQKLYS